MKTRKPRTKHQNPAYSMKSCPYDDDTVWKECNYPWADKCDGNIHKCAKLKMHHLASLSDKDREEYINKELERNK